jgi:hypothetical protein
VKKTLIALLGAVVLPAFAADVACPDLAAAVQVAPCPSEEELEFTYNGFCGDNARLYAKDVDTCTTFQHYKRVKNIALWEAANGEFQAYVSCDINPAKVKASKPQHISVGPAGKGSKVTRVACEYEIGVTFAHRTRAACKVVGDGNCGAGKDCKASCE